jgi:hypothetical protein
MTTFYRMLTILLFGGLLILAAGCGKKQDPAATSSDAPTVEAPDAPAEAAKAITEIKTVEIQYCNS